MNFSLGNAAMSRKPKPTNTPACPTLSKWGNRKKCSASSDPGLSSK